MLVKRGSDCFDVLTHLCFLIRTRRPTIPNRPEMVAPEPPDMVERSSALVGFRSRGMDFDVFFFIFGPWKGSPLYVAEKVTNPYGFVIEKPPILRGP